MVEKFIRKVENIEYAPPKVSEKVQKLIERQSKCKTIEKYLDIQLKLIKQTDGDWSKVELVNVFEDLIKKAKDMKPQRKKLVEVEIVDGWKGKDSLDIYKGVKNDFIIKSHSKDKHTNEVLTTTHHIPHQNVNTLLFYIKQWNIGESHKCYDFAPILGYDWKEIWKERMAVYFPMYYYPIKILEKIGIIKYGGRGTITRLK